MKAEDRPLKFVRRSGEGVVGRGADEAQADQPLGERVREDIEPLTAFTPEMPDPVARPRRELAGA